MLDVSAVAGGRCCKAFQLNTSVLKKSWTAFLWQSSQMHVMSTTKGLQTHLPTDLRITKIPGIHSGLDSWSPWQTQHHAQVDIDGEPLRGLRDERHER